MRVLRDRNVWMPYAEELLSNEIFVLVSAIAMNALLAFFPFMILLVSFSTQFFPSFHVHDMTYEILRDYLPLDSVNQDFIIDTLRRLSRRFGQIQIFSLIVLVWSIANVFIPLEMALNRAWGVREARGFWKSQQLAMLMVGLSGFLAFVFISGAAVFKYRLVEAIFGPDWYLTHAFLQFVIIKLWMIPFTVLMFCLMFYLVPNTKVPLKDVAVAAIFTGLLWEASRYGFWLVLPLLGLDDIYGGFKLTVTLMTWAYVSGIILVLGANLTVKRVLTTQFERIKGSNESNESKEG